ncbi:MAG: hypothetical protein CMM15_10650 [Rhodospirillaceae bacterium]|nr:hypothetical protein [Rhodospirillaceae bacterium]OUX68027.1 MAG: hypothetical protein CBD38_00985 [bacterium TMED178]|tara:strand:+ start:3828 stop:4208 length:381 start_codon:yes stop_codon:yes gene_type:complete
MDILENNLINSSYAFVPRYRKAFPLFSMKQRHQHLDNIVKHVNIIPREVASNIHQRHQEEKEKQISTLQKTYRPTLTCKANYPQNDYMTRECEEIKFVGNDKFYVLNIFIFILLNIILVLYAKTKS